MGLAMYLHSFVRTPTHLLGVLFGSLGVTRKYLMLGVVLAGILLPYNYGMAGPPSSNSAAFVEPYRAFWESTTLTFSVPNEPEILIALKRDAHSKMISMTVSQNGRSYIIDGSELAFIRWPEPSDTAVTFTPGPNGGTIGVELPYYDVSNKDSEELKFAFIYIKDMSHHQIYR